MKDVVFLSLSILAASRLLGDRKINVAYKHSGEDKGKLPGSSRIQTCCGAVWNRRETPEGENAGTYGMWTLTSGILHIQVPSNKVNISDNLQKLCL